MRELSRAEELMQFAGIMLGPDRFKHIRTVTLQALSLLSAALSLPTLLKKLRALDAEIALLAPPPTSPKKAETYEGVTEKRAERLVLAREKRLALLERLQAKEAKEKEEREDLEQLVRAVEEKETQEALEKEEWEGEIEEEWHEEGEEQEQATAGGKVEVVVLDDSD